MFEKFVVPNDLRPSDPRFGVGPSLLPISYVEKLAQTGHSLLGTSHRQAPIKKLLKEVQEGFKTYFNLPAGYEVILGNGGATFLFDMIGLGMVEQSSTHFTCGEFSNKWYQSHAKIPWIKAKNNEASVGQGIDPVEQEGFDMICGTLNETSTGVQLITVPAVKNGNTLVAIDATSGAGQIGLDLNKVDLYFFSPQKVFASEGGTFIAFMSPKAMERAQKIAKDKSRYIPEIMSWAHAIDNSLKNQTYNTPSISTFYFINEQLKEMNKLGQAKVLDLAEKKAKLVYGWAEQKSYLKPYVEVEKYRSRSVATIDMDEKFPAEELSAVLRTQGVAVDIDSYRKLGRNQFRISLFHNISYENLEKLTKIISLAVESH